MAGGSPCRSRVSQVISPLPPGGLTSSGQSWWVLPWRTSRRTSPSSSSPWRASGLALPSRPSPSAGVWLLLFEPWQVPDVCHLLASTWPSPLSIYRRQTRNAPTSSQEPACAGRTSEISRRHAQARPCAPRPVWLWAWLSNKGFGSYSFASKKGRQTSPSRF